MSDLAIGIPASERRQQRRRALLMEIGVVALLAIALIVLMPALLSGFRLNLLGRFLALAIVALGIDLIWGYTGLLSLGHGIFFALGVTPWRCTCNSPRLRRGRCQNL